jgi:hypothetical protein
MATVSFKERVKNVALSMAKDYKNVFVDYDYLVCSDAFSIKSHYIIESTETNFQHLTGVNSLISPKAFFDKCIDGTLDENDFDFAKRGQSEKDVIGTVRKKIKALPYMMNIFNNGFIVQESF